MCSEQAEKKKAGQSHLFTDGRREQAVRRDTFPEVTDGERMYQKNEGQWEFTLEESADGQALILDVHVGKFLDTSLIKVCPLHLSNLQQNLIQMALAVKAQATPWRMPLAVCTNFSHALVEEHESCSMSPPQLLQ